jgi:mannose-6-phosphate isomerase-like protein (cupin superfamily)
MELGVRLTRLDLDGGERVQTLRRDLGVSSFGLNLILLAPGQRGRIHRHARQEEVYVVLGGTLTLVVEDEPLDLTRGDVAALGPEVRRQLVNLGPDRCAVLAIGGAEPHEGRDGVAFRAWDDLEGASPQEIPLPEDLPASELR